MGKGSVWNGNLRSVLAGRLCAMDSSSSCITRTAPRIGKFRGGYVKPEECAHDGVVREVYEETRIRAKVEGLLGVRHRVKEGDNSTYLIFRLTPVVLHDPIPDGREVDAAKYFALEEIEAFSREEIPALNRWVARCVLGKTSDMLLDQGDPDGLDRPYNLYICL